MSAAAQPLLRTRDLWAHYGELAALRGVSIELGAGEVIGIAGPNGAGKSTLVRAVTGLLRPSAGAVELHGEDVTGLRAHLLCRRGVAHVPEGRGLFGELSVRDNLRLGALAVGRPVDPADVLDVFPVLGDRMDQKAASLSGGEQQILAIGRGLMARPELLVIDELSLGLAPKMTELIYRTLAELNARDGLGVVVVDENVRLLAQLASAIYVLTSGSVVARLSAAEVTTHPDVLHAYLGRA